MVPPAGRPALDAALDPFFNDLRTQLDELLATRALTPRAADAVAGFGELLASTILAFAFTHAGVDAAWVDCRRVIVTDHDFTRALPLYGPTDARLRETLLPLLRAGRVPVLGGYVGATLQGVTTTLGKEGSDFSAAIVGAALGAEEIADLDRRRRHAHRRSAQLPRRAADPHPLLRRGPGALLLGRQEAPLRHAGAGEPGGRADPHPRLPPPRRPRGR